MNDLLTTALGTGLSDGLNPCMLMSCAIFISADQRLATQFSRSGFLRAIFTLFYVVGLVAFNFGPAQTFVLQKKFVLAAKIIYLVLGLWALVQGFVYFKDWFATRKESSFEVKEKTALPLPLSALLILIAIVLAFSLSALSSLWPINKYFFILINETLMKGDWRALLWPLVGYVLASIWPLWLLLGVMGIKNLRPSLLKIINAAVFFAASSCLILIFK